MPYITENFRGALVTRYVPTKREKRQRYLYSKQGKGVNALACIGQACSASYEKEHIAEVTVDGVTLYFDFSDVYIDSRSQQVFTYIVSKYVRQVGSRPSVQDVVDIVYKLVNNS